MSPLPQPIGAGHDAAACSVKLAWESLHDLLQREPRPDLTELNAVSTVIHKLASALTQVKSVELKTREAEMKTIEFELKRKQLEATVREASREGELTPEILREIERRLDLL